ncbi:MAG: nucleoside-triphosphatase [Clostridium sp.]
MKNILLTGNIGAGKTTLLYKIIESLNLSIGGFKVNRHITQTGPIETKTFILSSYLNGIDNYKVATARTIHGNVTMNILSNGFEDAASPVIEASLRGRDVIVFDELGFMESNSPLFKSSIFKALNSNKLVLGVIKDRCCEFLDSIRSRDDVLIIQVTEENRNNLLSDILMKIRDYYKNDSVIRGDYFSSDYKRIHWYDMALNYSGCEYPSIFIDKIKELTSLKGKTILDIGSGTGGFAIPLSREASSVTALDFSINMRQFLEVKCIEENINNIRLITSPFEGVDIPPHNIVINAFASSVTKSYKSMKKLIDSTLDYAFIISHHRNDRYKFGGDILGKLLNRNLLTSRSEPEDNIHTMLDSFNVEYQYSEIEFSFPQYFEDINDAINFFTKYFKLSTKEVDIAKNYLEKTLIQIDRGYIYPETRRARFIVIKKGCCKI